MTTRILPPDEWHRLRPMWDAIDQVTPDALTVVVAEDDAGEIAGCWGLITLAHVEGIWIRPDHRARSVVLRKLWRAMRALVTGRQIGAVITGADHEGIGAMLTAMQAQPLPPQFLLSMDRRA